MPYLYGVADTKFVKYEEQEQVSLAETTKFRRCDFLAPKQYFNHNDVPFDFKTTPQTLMELCLSVLDKIPLSATYEWNELQVLQWLASYGYPQYRNTFRVNMITGRKLLLVDASALSAMNIKDFNHIRHLTKGIRRLFQYDLAHMHYEMFKLFHTRTGPTYDELRRSDLWRLMQLIREKSPNYQHWDLLELWLKREPVRSYVELIGYAPRLNLYKCSTEMQKTLLQDSEQPYTCTCCVPPCECQWTERDLRLPWRLSCLPVGLNSARSKWAAVEQVCTSCIPPCECRWPSIFYLTGTVLNCLQQKFPEKFSPIFDDRFKAELRPSLLERWTRFSF